MKKIFITLLCTLLLNACHQPPTGTLIDSNHKRYDVAEMQGKWVFINYFADWCPPCRQEIPALNKFSQKNKADVIFLAVEFDGKDADELNDLAKELEIEYPLLVTDPAPIFGLEKVNKIPTTFVIDPEGKLHKTLYGAQNARSLQNSME